jgi:trk system potassium uptake protein TrkH
MILGALNFALHFAAWRARTLRPYWVDPENRFYLGSLAVVAVILVAGLVISQTLPLGAAVRHALFQLATFSTSTGLTTTAYYQWPDALQFLLLVVGCVGGCAGSTAGGIKAIRILLLMKQGRREILRLIHPHMQMFIKLGDRIVAQSVVSAVWAFLATYMAVFMAAFFILMGTGLDQITAFSAVVATINNLGIGLGEVSTNFGGLTSLAKWVLTLTMLMGRLEIFTVLVLFTPAFWRR